MVAELAVVTLHGAQSLDPLPSMPSPGNVAKKSPPGGAYKGQAAGGKSSLVGTISLPRPAFDSKGAEEDDGSGSDIPSESSASSEDEVRTRYTYTGYSTCMYGKLMNKMI
ncbi:hypothetical protein EON64_11115 [archaeon]|nr:MAG: hypothetical protein EON64_11115 [archaeon]